jgi:hypothetical protein
MFLVVCLRSSASLHPVPVGVGGAYQAHVSVYATHARRILKAYTSIPSLVLGVGLDILIRTAPVRALYHVITSNGSRPFFVMIDLLLIFKPGTTSCGMRLSQGLNPQYYLGSICALVRHCLGTPLKGIRHVNGAMASLLPVCGRSLIPIPGTGHVM